MLPSPIRAKLGVDSFRKEGVCEGFVELGHGRAITCFVSGLGCNKHARGRPVNSIEATR